MIAFRKNFTIRFRYKPVSISSIIRPLYEDYENLFNQTFDRSKNKKFFAHLTNCLFMGRFSDLLRLIIESSSKALNASSSDSMSWAEIIVRARKILQSISSKRSALPFAYVKGTNHFFAYIFKG